MNSSTVPNLKEFRSFQRRPTAAKKKQHTKTCNRIQLSEPKQLSIEHKHSNPGQVRQYIRVGTFYSSLAHKWHSLLRFMH